VTSLRHSLAARFAATMFVALIVIALWAYQGVHRTVYGLLDLSLRTTAQLQTDALAASGALAARPGTTDPAEFLQKVNRLVALRDASGRIVAESTPLARRLAVDSAGFAKALAGDTITTTERWLNYTVRVLYVPAPPGSPPNAAVLQIAASFERLHDATRAILYRVLATAILGTLATLIGASWLAASSLAPVNDIATQAEAVTGRSPGERITVHAGVAEFASLITVLNDMLTRLERAASWHQRVIRDLGHDLRTPITAMRAGIEVALWSERTTDEYRRVLASALEEVDRLTLISDALVLMGRLASGQLTAQAIRIDARVVAGESVRRAQQRIGGHRVSLAGAEPAPVTADPRLLGTALDQLIDNGMRHTPPGTPVVVSTRSADGTVELTVEDHGPGVEDELLPHLFEPFYRADGARGRDSGAGLGLTVAATIIDLHHGTIGAERADMGGLRVRVRLPVAKGVFGGRSSGVPG